MLKDRMIICLASGYDAPPTSKHHIMHLLAEENIILWVNYHASRTPKATASDLQYMMLKLKQVVKGLQNPRKNLFVLTPLVIPLPAKQWARQLNRHLLIIQIKRATSKISHGFPIQIWSFTPDVAYVLGHFNEEKVVYYCVDDHASFTGYDKEQVLRDEKELCSRSDLVITTSMALHKAKSPWNPNTILVPHGVDYQHFKRAVTEELPCPEDLKPIPKLRLGFFGLIRDWVDIELLAKVAEKRPKWNFVIIGDNDSSIDIKKYATLSNIHFLGRKPYSELPSYCRYLDVGLIPFKINDLTYAVNPIKLREYLSAGLPVVSTPMPEVMLYKDLVEIADSPESFEKAIERCLEKGSTQQKIARMEAMANETWEAKLQIIYEGLFADTPYQ